MYLLHILSTWRRVFHAISLSFVEQRQDYLSPKVKHFETHSSWQFSHYFVDNRWWWPNNERCHSFDGFLSWRRLLAMNIDGYLHHDYSSRYHCLSLSVIWPSRKWIVKNVQRSSNALGAFQMLLAKRMFTFFSYVLENFLEWRESCFAATNAACHCKQ